MVAQVVSEKARGAALERRQSRDCFRLEFAQPVAEDGKWVTVMKRTRPGTKAGLAPSRRDPFPGVGRDERVPPQGGVGHGAVEKKRPRQPGKTPKCLPGVRHRNQLFGQRRLTDDWRRR